MHILSELHCKANIVTQVVVIFFSWCLPITAYLSGCRSGPGTSSVYGCAQGRTDH
ncbi:unnamed protein product, partial [Staurois parvus]